MAGPSINAWREVLQAMAEENVEFVICGGIAVLLHGINRTTHDLDLYVRLDEENVERLITVAKRLKLHPRIPEPMIRLADPEHRRRWMEEKGAVVFTLQDDTGLRHIDVFIQYPVPYDELCRDAKQVPLGGLDALISSKQHLIRAKRAVDPPRKQDLRDIEDLQEIIDHERQNTPS